MLEVGFSFSIPSAFSIILWWRCTYVICYSNICAQRMMYILQIKYKKQRPFNKYLIRKWPCMITTICQQCLNMSIILVSIYTVSLYLWLNKFLRIPELTWSYNIKYFQFNFDTIIVFFAINQDELILPYTDSMKHSLKCSSLIKFQPNSSYWLTQNLRKNWNHIFETTSIVHSYYTKYWLPP